MTVVGGGMAVVGEPCRALEEAAAEAGAEAGARVGAEAGAEAGAEVGAGACEEAGAEAGAINRLRDEGGASLPLFDRSVCSAASRRGDIRRSLFCGSDTSIVNAPAACGSADGSAAVSRFSTLRYRIFTFSNPFSALVAPASAALMRFSTAFTAFSAAALDFLSDAASTFLRPSSS